MAESQKFFEHTRKHHWNRAIAVILISMIGGGFWYGYMRNSILTRQVALLTQNTNELKTTTQSLYDYIYRTETSLINEQKIIRYMQERFGTFQGEVEQISGTISTLDKLSKLDPELLQKYSKVFFLNEHYEPNGLKEIPSEYKYSNTTSREIHTQIYPYLINLMNAARGAGEELYVFSSYRSFGTQNALKNQYTVTYGAGTANQFSAEQGYSEHQLGSTVDFITTGLNGDLKGFEKTSEYTWLKNNAYKYGFILSYPQGNTYYIFEPWHWRFVGIKLATYLHSTNQNFYDVDQRLIDEYLISIFD